MIALEGFHIFCLELLPDFVFSDVPTFPRISSEVSLEIPLINLSGVARKISLGFLPLFIKEFQ